MDRVYAPAFRSVNAGSGLTGSSRVVRSLNRAARGGNHSSHRVSPRGIIAATKGIKATTDYTDFTDGKRRTKRKMNLNSRTQKQINRKGGWETYGFVVSWIGRPRRMVFSVGAPAGRARSEKGRTAEYPPQIGEGAPRSVDLWSAPSRKNRTTELEDARTGRSTLREPRFPPLSFIISNPVTSCKKLSYGDGKMINVFLKHSVTGL